MSIQGSINSMINTIAGGVGLVKGLQKLQNSPQAQASQMAQMSAQNEIEAKRAQKEQFAQTQATMKESIHGRNL